MKDYYKILRISRLATRDEIKRAYRRLAVVFHPDKNQSEEASNLFQEINEAHQVLSDPETRERYDQLLKYGPVAEDRTPSQRMHRDPAYRRRQQPGYRPPPPRPSERLLMMLHLLRYFRTVCLVGVGWCAILMLDYLLPYRISNEGVLSESERYISWQFHHVPYVLVTDKGHQFPIDFEAVQHFPVGSRADVITSRMLNLLVKVESENKSYTVRSLATVYQNFIFVPAILLLLSVIGLTLKNGIEFRFSFAVAICVILFFNLIFLLFSIL